MNDVAEQTEQKPERGWVWWSNPQTAEAGVVSVLAIVETLCATSLSVWIAWRFDTITHVLVGCSVAPLLLLRTPESTELGLAGLERSKPYAKSRSAIWTAADEMVYFTRITVDGSSLDFIRSSLHNLPRLAVFGAVSIPLSFAILLFPPLAYLVIRVSAIVRTIRRTPLGTIWSIPSNWKRICVNLDSTHPPEVVPGIELALRNTKRGSIEDVRLSEMIKFQIRTYSANYVMQFIGVGSFIIYFVFVYIPALAYRWSLKATSIVYLPLLFIVRSKRDNPTAAERIDDIESGSTEALQWYYAIFVLIATAASLFVIDGGFESATELLKSESTVTTFLRTHYLPTNGEAITIKGWHVARVANAALIIWLGFYADRARRRLRSGTWSDADVGSLLDRIAWIQKGLTVYTIYCGLLWLWKYRTAVFVPSVEFQFVP